MIELASVFSSVWGAQLAALHRHGGLTSGTSRAVLVHGLTAGRNLTHLIMRSKYFSLTSLFLISRIQAGVHRVYSAKGILHPHLPYVWPYVHSHQGGTTYKLRHMAFFLGGGGTRAENTFGEVNDWQLATIRSVPVKWTMCTKMFKAQYSVLIPNTFL